MLNLQSLYVDIKRFSISPLSATKQQENSQSQPTTVGTAIDPAYRAILSLIVVVQSLAVQVTVRPGRYQLRQHR